MASMTDESEALDVVSKAVARRLGANRAELTLTNGVVLEFRPISPVLTNSIQAELRQRMPRPPRVYIEEKGREEENPNDPEYLAALVRQDHLNEIALSDALTYAGVRIKHVPEGVHPPESDEWLSDPRIVMARRAGLEFDPEDEVKRKVVWMRLYALETYTDARLWDEVQITLLGITEEEVAEALASFRGVQERTADNGSPPEEPNPNGDSDNRATRRARSRVRGA